MMSYPEFLLCVALALFAASIIGTYIIQRRRFPAILPISIFIVGVALVSLLMMSCGYVATIPQAETVTPAAPIKLNSVFYAEPEDTPETVVVIVDKLYIRSCSSTACNPYTHVTRGTHLRLVADSVKSDDPHCSLWVEIEVASIEGFVCREFVR